MGIEEATDHFWGVRRVRPLCPKHAQHALIHFEGFIQLKSYTSIPISRWIKIFPFEKLDIIRQKIHLFTNHVSIPRTFIYIKSSTCIKVESLNHSKINKNINWRLHYSLSYNANIMQILGQLFTMVLLFEIKKSCNTTENCIWNTIFLSFLPHYLYYFLTFLFSLIRNPPVFFSGFLNPSKLFSSFINRLTCNL